MWTALNSFGSAIFSFERFLHFAPTPAAGEVPGLDAHGSPMSLPGVRSKSPRREPELIPVPARGEGEPDGIV